MHAYAFAPHQRTPIEATHARIVSLCLEALRHRDYEENEAHLEILRQVPPGVYEDELGIRYRVEEVLRDMAENGHEQYFVLYRRLKPAKNAEMQRRLLVGTGHGERSGWFQYIEEDGLQRFRFTLVSS